MLTCWLAWFKRMTLRDTLLSYEVHMQMGEWDASNSSESSWRSSAWLEGIMQKVRFLLTTIHQVPEGALVLLTDLDVMPLNPYSGLVAAMPPSRDLMMMHNYQTHFVANSGFQLLRNNVRTRLFVDTWLAEMMRFGLSPNKDDQRFFNIILYDIETRPDKRPGLNLSWATFPHNLVGAKLDGRFVTPRTIAFHALGRPSSRSKLQRMDEVLQLLHSGSDARSSLVWQRPCDRTAIESSGCSRQAHRSVQAYPPSPPPSRS